jgi:dipeptidyl aminopeptidase/acylaminoacyl peptidase
MSLQGKKSISRTLLVLVGTVLPLVAQNRPQTVAYQFSHTAVMDPTLSPDGKEMIYIMVIAGKDQLMRRAVDGSYVRQLTNDATDHEDPAWAPDGKKVAYVQIKDSQEQVYLMNPDGSGQEPLTPSDVRTIHPSWSADGRAITYCTDDDEKPPKKNPSQIYSIDLPTRRITTLISGGVNTYPAWSPDGKQLAFRRMLGESNSEVFVANADGLVSRRDATCVCLQSRQSELSDLHNESRRQRRSPGCGYRRPRHRTKVVPGWQNHLLHGLPQSGIGQRLRDLCREAGRVSRMVKKLIFASKEREFTRPKAHAASRS